MKKIFGFFFVALAFIINACTRVPNRPDDEPAMEYMAQGYGMDIYEEEQEEEINSMRQDLLDENSEDQE